MSEVSEVIGTLIKFTGKLVLVLYHLHFPIIVCEVFTFCCIAVSSWNIFRFYAVPPGLMVAACARLLSFTSLRDCVYNRSLRFRG